MFIFLLRSKIIIDEKTNKHGKIMEGLPIYDLDEATFKKLEEEEVKLIIIANKEISGGRLNFIVDKALQYGMRVQQVPPITQ